MFLFFSKSNDFFFNLAFLCFALLLLQKMRYFIEFSYNGTNYHGWQKQTNAITVQEKLNTCLSLQLSQKIDVIGAGRTDTGVHAIQMFGHFDSTSQIDCDELIFKLNSFLSNDILIHSVFPVSEDMHARFSATERTYKYVVSNKRDLFNRNIYVLNKSIDIDRMNESCKLILGERDFSSFSKSRTDTHTNICNVSFAEWTVEKDYYIFIVRSNRFLRNMVRSLVGTILDIGVGKKDINSISSILEKRDRRAAGDSVPAKALFLIRIEYPNLSSYGK